MTVERSSMEGLFNIRLFFHVSRACDAVLRDVVWLVREAWNTTSKRNAHQLAAAAEKCRPCAEKGITHTSNHVGCVLTETKMTPRMIEGTRGEATMSTDHHHMAISHMGGLPRNDVPITQTWTHENATLSHAA